MTIAADASSIGTDASATSLTIAHTCTGSNLILWVFVRTNISTDNVSGVTYNSVAMTRVCTIANPTSSRRSYLYFLVNPSTGTNNIVISLSALDSVAGHGYSFTGASQTGQPDATATNSVTGAANATNITTVADNCWIMSGHANDESDHSSTTGFTYFQGNGGSESGYTNGPQTPAGVKTLTWSYGGAVNDAIVLASFSPAADPVTSRRNYSYIM